MLRIEIEQKTDGRWFAEIAALPGVMAYGRAAGLAALNPSKEAGIAGRISNIVGDGV